MGLLEETKRILMAHEVRLRRRFGQNFLVDEGILKKLVSYASVNDDDIILEVGAGLGFLTEHLARIAKQVIAVEIDPKIVRILMHRLSNYRNVVILRGDILKISNLPYFNKVVS
ncbi:MAG: rRNA adenine N-6-methyltransferase family protein, partial [Candidatus Bathyarchaeia archaeon]